LLSYIEFSCHWLSAQKFSHSAQDTGSFPLLHSARRRLAAEVIIADRHTLYKKYADP
jgi:hypothetical protein